MTSDEAVLLMIEELERLMELVTWREQKIIRDVIDKVSE